MLNWRTGGKHRIQEPPSPPKKQTNKQQQKHFKPELA